MGIFTKPTSTPISNILPFIQTPPDSLVWTITDTTGGIDTVSVAGFSDNYLDEAYSEFLEAWEMPKVIRYAPDYDPHNFRNVDYVRGLSVRLYPERIFFNGVLNQVNYYANVSLDSNGQEVFDDLVVKEEYVYNRNADGFATSRTLLITWITEANLPHPDTKTRFKTYNLMESIKEINRRRANILDSLKASIIGMLVSIQGMTTDAAIQSGQAFFESHMGHIITFKEVGEVQALIDAINADLVTSWLDLIVSPPTTTMRDYITTTLSGAILVGA